LQHKFAFSSPSEKQYCNQKRIAARFAVKMWTVMVVLALVAPSFQGAVMRFGCSSLKRDRIDPCVEHRLIGRDAEEVGNLG
jgi:hypothetical protein